MKLPDVYVVAPNDARDLPGFISGTPQSGWYDLDRSEWFKGRMWSWLIFVA